eukprot:TRINITY_DN25513_c0_g1_i2.p1 TRINITY_DN25513_c0_g1~~TRINITY_DN25513_c0_g1_i2.p1  ORF type:complete len:538 (-),score=21.13 TRINITY_DN25513_c0_g1_i2:79-1692(-)
MVSPTQRSEAQAIGKATLDELSSAQIGGDVAQISASQERRANPVLLFQLCICSALDGADAVLLPSTIGALQNDLDLSMHSVATMNLMQALTISAAGPFWGVLADRQIFERRKILAMGAVVQGLLTILLGMTSTFPLMLFLRSLNGVMLSALRPVANGIIADVTSDAFRGEAYGWIDCAIMLGSMAGALVGTPLATRDVLGFSGWRVAYSIIGWFSICVGACLAVTMAEPAREQEIVSRSVKEEFLGLLGDLRTPTFCVITLQGCFGSVPGNAMSFLTLFLQVGGIDGTKAAILQAFQMSSSAVGRLMGGRIGDAFARRCPLHGRACAAQISVFSGIPIAAFIFTMSPPTIGAFPFYLTLVVLMGLFSTWCGCGVNRPILSEIVGPDRRSAIMAWQSAMEGTFAAIFGNVAVGFLAEDVFGYSLESARSHADSLTDPDNRRALGKALALTTCGPWIVCFLFYALLHWSYPRDMKKRRQLQQGGDSGRDNLSETQMTKSSCRDDETANLLKISEDVPSRRRAKSDSNFIKSPSMAADQA